MADFATTYTARLRIQYRSLDRSHTSIWRYGLLATPPTAPFVAGVIAFYDAIAAIRYTDWSFQGATYAAEGSNTFLPYTGAITIAAGQAAIPQAVGGFKPVFISFQVITAIGNRGSLFVYGVSYDPANSGSPTEQDYRVTTTEDATISDGVDALQAVPGLTGIDAETVLVYRYANIGYNAYYQRKARRG